MGVAVRGAAVGSCGPGVVAFVPAWEEAVEELDAMASAVPLCALSAAERARLVGESPVGIGMPSVRGLFVRRWGSAVGDICRCCRPLGSIGLLLSLEWKATRHAAKGGMRLWCWAFADLLVPCSDCGVRGECCPVAEIRGVSVVVVRPGVGERPEWGQLRIAWGCRSGGLSVRALRVAGAYQLPRGPLGRRRPLAMVARSSVWCGRASEKWTLDCPDVMPSQGLSDAKGRSVVPPPMQLV